MLFFLGGGIKYNVVTFDYLKYNSKNNENSKSFKFNNYILRLVCYDEFMKEWEYHVSLYDYKKNIKVYDINIGSYYNDVIGNDVDIIVNLEESCFYVSHDDSTEVYDLYKGTKLVSSSNIKKPLNNCFAYFYGKLVIENNGIVSIYNKNLQSIRNINLGRGRKTSYHFIKNDDLYFIEWISQSAYLCKRNISGSNEQKVLVHEYENSYVSTFYCIPFACGDNEILIQKRIQGNIFPGVCLYNRQNLAKIFSNLSLKIINSENQLVRTLYDGGNYIYISSYMKHPEGDGYRDTMLKKDGTTTIRPFSSLFNSAHENKNAISIIRYDDKVGYVTDSFKPKIAF